MKKKKEKIEKWLFDNEGKQEKRGKEIQSNTTDNESAKMKTSHGVIQGYNCQALVDSKHVKERGKITNKEYQVLTSVSKPMATIDLRDILKNRNTCEKM